MTDQNTEVIITLRDVYDSVNQLDGKLDSYVAANTAWQVAHGAEDAKAFAALNVKFYGILAAIVTVLAAVIVPHL